MNPAMADVPVTRDERPLCDNGVPTNQQAFGQQDPANPRPMGRDSIFRIYSMTKPIVRSPRS
jgi:CubicO group peptidase (beta-lactamase class C family)